MTHFCVFQTQKMRTREMRNVRWCALPDEGKQNERKREREREREREKEKLKERKRKKVKQRNREFLLPIPG